MNSTRLTVHTERRPLAHDTQCEPNRRPRTDSFGGESTCLISVQSWCRNGPALQCGCQSYRATLDLTLGKGRKADEQTVEVLFPYRKTMESENLDSTICGGRLSVS